MRDDIESFSNRGVEIVAISSEPSIESVRAVRAGGIPFAVLSDPDRTVIAEWGLKHDDPEADHPVSRPAVFLVDSAGIVRFGFVGEHSRDRLENGALLLAIDRLLT